MREAEENDLRNLRKERDFYHHLALTYMVEIQKLNKGVRRLKKKVERLRQGEL